MTSFPESLTIISIEGWHGRDVSIHLPVYPLSPKQEHLRRLTRLELHVCQVHIPLGSITCLEGLTSLCIRHSGIGGAAHPDQVMKLTNLKCLELTGTYPHQGLAAPGRPWNRFEAWPALCVLKFIDCWFTDKSTALGIAVQELHTDRLTPSMDMPKMDLTLGHTHHDLFYLLTGLLSPMWCTCIVYLQVHFTDMDDTPLYFAAVVKQLLEELL